MKPAIIAASLALMVTAANAETALEIATRFDQSKIEAINEYLSKNAAAEDKDVALDILVRAYSNIGEFEKVPALLEQRYELADKGEDADLDFILGQLTRHYMSVAAMTGNKEGAKQFIARIQKDFASSPDSDGIDQYLSQLGRELATPSVGETMDLKFTDIEGKAYNLADKKGKVVLVDFWATWCGPCIAEMPNVISTYNEYKDKGFEVVGISLDEDLDELKSFIAEHKMTWPQQADGKGWQNEIAAQFGISGIPATFLVGKDGKIIGANLRGEELGNAVKAAVAAEAN